MIDLAAKDIIAIITIVGGFYLMANGIDTVVGGVVTLIAGYYFGAVSRYKAEHHKKTHLEGG